MEMNKDFMKMGTQEKVSESVDVSMKKVMIDSANNSEKDTSGGSIMKEGSYSFKSVSGDSKKLNYSYDGPGYLGEK
jgi:hypothetical protein